LRLPGKIAIIGFPDKLFSLSFFKYDKDLTTEEASKIERDERETVKYEYISLEELRDRACKHADEVMDVCTKHSESLKNCKSPKEAIELCDNFQNLMKEYEADCGEILKGFEHKRINPKQD
jgi:hypothetical protein